MMKRFSVLLILFASMILFASADTLKFTSDQMVHFTIDNDEQKDFSIDLQPGEYNLLLDVKRLNRSPIKLMKATIEAVKPNGAVLDPLVLQFSESDLALRVGKRIVISKPLTERLRFHNQDSPIEVWMRLLPAEQTATWIPFAFDQREIKPLLIGDNEGKRGTLASQAYAYHSISLKSGSWIISLYLRRQDNLYSTFFATLDQFNSLGLRVARLLDVRDTGEELREKARIFLNEPQTVLFRVQNGDVTPVDYIIGVQKGPRN